MLGLIRMMVSTFVQIYQFGTRFQRGVKCVPLFEKIFQLGPFQKKVINTVNGIGI